MSRDVVQAALSLAAASGLPFHVQLAGGEPTLEPGLIEFVGGMVREARWPTTLALQTNGTLIDRCLADLCRRYDIGVGVSLDGPPEVQEKLRGGSGATFRGLSILETMRVPVRVTTVLSSINAGRLYDLALSIARFGNIRGVGLDPIVLKGEAKRIPDLFPSQNAVRSGVQALLGALKQIHWDCGVCLSWRELDAVRRALSRSGPAGPYCHACRAESLAVHPDGTVYPCGQTIGDSNMAAGTVDSIDWVKLKTCYQSFQLGGECSDCPLAGRCPGDCPSRLRYNNGTGTNAMCIIYRTIAQALTEKPGERRIS
jgi:uncharacterized protein